MWSLKQDMDAAKVDAKIVVPSYRDPFDQSFDRPTKEAQRTRLVVDSNGDDVFGIDALSFFFYRRLGFTRFGAGLAGDLLVDMLDPDYEFNLLAP